MVNDDAKIYFYNFHLTFLHFFSKTIPDQLLENVLLLEDSIARAETVEKNLQYEIFTQSEKIYELYDDKIREKRDKTYEKL